MRIVTFSNQEYLIVAKDPSYLEKIMPFVHSLQPDILVRNQAIMEVQRYQEKWVKGVISNGEYLIYLNFVGNRSFNDLT